MLEEGEEPDAKLSVLFKSKGVTLVTLLFLGLIWLDSAAFYLIQSSEVLRKASWDTDQQLWMNACIHYAMALCGGWILDRGWVFRCLIGAFVLLEVGAWIFEEGTRFAGMATILYVSGVSLYSTALVGYAALSPQLKNNWRISTRAGLVFAIGGWFGSAMGIGMAKDLNAIPGSFLLIALLIVVGSVMAKWRFDLKGRSASAVS